MTTEAWIALGGIAITLVSLLVAASNRAGALTKAVEGLTSELRHVRDDIEADRKATAERAADDRERHEDVMRVLSEHGERIAKLEARVK